MKQDKIVITGGPGTGKSSLIEELIAKGFTCMPEISRTITREAQESGIDQLFLKDPLLFSQLLLEGRIGQYTKASESKSTPVFFDRGIPDIFAYMEFFGSEIPDEFIDSSMGYRYTRVFMLPPWKAIYKTDNERYESFPQAMRIYDHLKQAYSKVNYSVVTVPQGSIHERVDYILNSL